MKNTRSAEIFRMRRKSVAGIIILLLANAGVYAFLSFYQRPQLAAMQERAFAVRRSLKGGITQDAAAVYRQGKADLETWNNRIPVKRDFARVVGELMAVAKRNSLSLGSISYKPSPVKGERQLVYTISFNVAGKYGKIKSFISDISRMRDIVVINNLSLNNSKMTEEDVDLKLELSAHFRMEG
jgi:type IV pilus assembly protein PilO